MFCYRVPTALPGAPREHRCDCREMAKLSYRCQRQNLYQNCLSSTDVKPCFCAVGWEASGVTIRETSEINV